MAAFPDVGLSDLQVGSVTFEIEGMLWAQPLPLNLYLETELDLEVGQANVRERGHSGSR